MWLIRRNSWPPKRGGWRTQFYVREAPVQSHRRVGPSYEARGFCASPVQLHSQSARYFPGAPVGDGFVPSHGAFSSLQENFLLHIPGGLPHLVRPAEITPIIVIGTKGEDFFFVGGEMQIGSDDREHAFFSHQRKKTRRNHVDAGKSQHLQLLWRSNGFTLMIAARSPPAKLKLLVEEQVSRRLPFLHRQGGESLMFNMKLHHASEINRAVDIDIVQNERLFKTAGTL